MKKEKYVKICPKCGSTNINIAGMTFGREKPGGRAISVFNVDTGISADLFNKIMRTENILSAKVIKI